MSPSFLSRVEMWSRQLIDPLRSRYAWQRITSMQGALRGYRDDASAGCPIEPPVRTKNGIFLRLTDPYSYLLIQLIHELYTDHPDSLPDWHMMISSVQAPHPTLTEQAWQAYALEDTKLLAKQHRLQAPDALPTLTNCVKGMQILGSQLTVHAKSLHLVLQVFHMVWQNQHAKLNLLLALNLKQQASQRSLTDSTPSASVSSGVSSVRQDTAFAVLQGYCWYQQDCYEGFEGLRVLFNQLKQDKQLPQDATYFIDHIDWQDDVLLNDPEQLSDLHEQKVQLELFITLEDPRSFFALAYLMHECVPHYHIKLKLRIVSYQGNDNFDWLAIASHAHDMGMSHILGCRPNALAAEQIALAVYCYRKKARNTALLNVLQQVWQQAQSSVDQAHVAALVNQHDTQPILLPRTKTHAPRVTRLQRSKQPQDAKQRSVEDVRDKLAKNTRLYEQLAFPCLPALRLKVGNHTHTLAGLQQVSRIEALLS